MNVDLLWLLLRAERSDETPRKDDESPSELLLNIDNLLSERTSKSLSARRDRVSPERSDLKLTLEPEPDYVRTQL